ncbi:formate dehydrogenase, partial [Streptomyces sp. NPDC056121]
MVEGLSVLSIDNEAKEELEPRVGPLPKEDPEYHPYHHPAAGWGAAKSVTQFLVRERELVDGPRAIMKMNHENTGFDCPGCA